MRRRMTSTDQRWRTSGPPLLGCMAWVGLVSLVAGALGCGNPKLIPNTKVADSELNREILGVVERYRKAMERRDAAGVLALVHPTYRDNGGTPEANDDLDLESLKQLLAGRFKLATKVRYRIEYQRLGTKGREAEVDTWIDATFIYEVPNATPRWRRYTDNNRFRLLKDGRTWRFISGL